MRLLPRIINCATNWLLDKTRNLDLMELTILPGGMVEALKGLFGLHHRLICVV